MGDETAHSLCLPHLALKLGLEKIKAEGPTVTFDVADRIVCGRGRRESRQDDRRSRRNWCTASPLLHAESATMGSTKPTGTRESDPSTMLGLVVLVVMGLVAAIAVGVTLGFVVT